MVYEKDDGRRESWETFCLRKAAELSALQPNRPQLDSRRVVVPTQREIEEGDYPGYGL